MRTFQMMLMLARKKLSLTLCISRASCCKMPSSALILVIVSDAIKNFADSVDTRRGAPRGRGRCHERIGQLPQQRSPMENLPSSVNCWNSCLMVNHFFLKTIYFSEKVSVANIRLSTKFSKSGENSGNVKDSQYLQIQQYQYHRWGASDCESDSHKTHTNVPCHRLK